MRHFITKFIRSKKIAVIIAAIMVTASSGAVIYAVTNPGLWYVDAFHIPDAKKAGYTGKGVTIAVMDSPINPDIPTLKGANITIRPKSFCWDTVTGDYSPAISTELSGSHNARHGTGVASMIVGNGVGYSGQQGVVGVASGARVLYYVTSTTRADKNGEECATKDGTSATKGVFVAIAAAMHEAISAGADIISLSSVGTEEPYVTAAVADALRAGVIIVAGLPNDPVGQPAFPAIANGVIAVGAIDSSAKPNAPGGIPNSYGNGIVVAGPGVLILDQGGAGPTWQNQDVATGTSLATPVIAGFLADVKQKYPKATNNQLIQSLIHNTSRADKTAPPDSYFGYGIASLTSMLKADPTQYPDVNPLIVAGKRPTSDEIKNGVKPIVNNTVPTEDNTSHLAGWILLGTFIVLLLGIAAIVIIIVKKRRARRAKETLAMTIPLQPQQPMTPVQPTAFPPAEAPKPDDVFNPFDQK